jgi:hypothetical protein
MSAASILKMIGDVRSLFATPHDEADEEAPITVRSGYAPPPSTGRISDPLLARSGIMQVTEARGADRSRDIELDLDDEEPDTLPMTPVPFGRRA